MVSIVVGVKYWKIFDVVYQAGEQVEVVGLAELLMNGLRSVERGENPVTFSSSVLLEDTCSARTKSSNTTAE